MADIYYDEITNTFSHAKSLDDIIRIGKHYLTSD